MWTLWEICWTSWKTMAYTSDLPLSALSGEEKLFLERIRDLVTLCDQRGIPQIFGVS